MKTMTSADSSTGADSSTSADSQSCPFAFNFDAASFKAGDLVSYRMRSLGDFPFVGKLVEVEADHVVLHHEGAPDEVYKATRESRPVVLD